MENRKFRSPEMSLAAYVRWTQKMDRRAYEARYPDFVTQTRMKANKLVSETRDATSHPKGGLWQ